MPKKSRARISSFGKEQPGLKSLDFKRIKPDLWSVRARSGFRALATFDDGRFLWLWIWQKRGQPFRITQSQLREVVMNVGLSASKIKRYFDDFAAFLPPNV
jgi:hypothetical protein